jgi:formylmethanofuran dehydrogenase subunit B
MDFGKEDLVNALNISLKELQQGIDVHCCLVTSMLNDRADERDLKAVMRLCETQPREVKYKNAIKEAIQVIEDSKKSLK